MNLDKVWEQVPALAVLVFIVVVFLRAQSKRDDAFLGFVKDANDKFKNLGYACHQVQVRAHDAITENTKMYGRLEKTMEQVAKTINEIGVERRGHQEARSK